MASSAQKSASVLPVQYSAPQTNTTPTTATTTSHPFPFPAHYSFPPFFTIQPAAQTRASQLASWSALVQAYSRHHRIFQLALVDACEWDLFRNRRLGRRLAPADAAEVLRWMCSEEGDHRAEWVGEAGGGGGDAGAGGKEGTGRCWIYWRRPEEWGVVVEDWVEATGQKNTVLTVYELLESDATAQQEFHGMDPELLQKALQTVVKRGRAQIFGSGDQRGVKFF